MEYIVFYYKGKGLRIFIFFLTFILLSSTQCILCAEDNQTKELEQLDFANGLFQRGLYQMAITEYKEFIVSFPQSEALHDAYFGIAESLFFLKSYKESIEAYREYIKNFPNEERTTIAGLRVGQSLFLIKNYDEALSSLTAVNEANLDNNFKQILYFYIGKTCRARGDKDKALEYYKKTQGLSEKSAYTVYALLENAEMLSEASEYAKAIEYYDLAYNKAETNELKGFSLYEKGKGEFSSGDYSNSAQTFKKVLSEYPNQDILQDATANMLLSLFNISKYEDLIIEYQNNQGLIGKDASFFNAHYIVASAYSQLSRYNEALSVLDNILSIESLSEENKQKALFLKAEVLIKSGQFEQALKLIDEKFTGAKDDGGRLIFLRAEACYGLGEFDKSYPLYKQIVEEFPGSSFSDSALYNMAHVKKSQGANQDAIDAFKRYFKEGKDDSRRREALYNSILIEMNTALIEKAIEDSELYLANFKKGKLNEKLLFRLGSLYSQIKNYQKAADTFKIFISSFPESTNLIEAYFLAAYNLQLAQDFDEALEYYEKIPQDKSSNFFYTSLKNKAFIYLKREENEKAAEILNKIIKEFQQDDLGVDAYLWLVKYDLAGKNFSDALDILASAQSKQGAAARMGEIAYFKAEAYRQLKNFTEAVKEYDSALSVKEENLSVVGASHIGKGLCLVEMNDSDKAKAEFEAAILASPEDNTVAMRARFEIASVEKLSGNLAEAAKLYMLVAVLYRDDYYCPQALFFAGELFEKLGRNQDALKAYQEIAATYKKSDLCEKAQERSRVIR